MAAPRLVPCGALALACLLVAAVAHEAPAQAAATPPACTVRLDAASLEERVDLMHTLNTAKEVAQPALFQHTWPDSGDGYGTVNAALRYALCNSTRLTLGPYAEYVWSSLSSKRVNTFRAGADAEWQWRDIGRATHAHSPLLLVQGSHKEDREADTEAGQLVAKLTWISAAGRGPRPNATWRLGALADVVWSPNIGVVVEAVREAKADSLEGTIVRALAQADVLVYPAAQRLERRLELFGSWIVQSDLSDGTAERKARFAYARAGVSWFALREEGRAAGVTLARVQGDDPTRALLAQRHWQLGVTLRIR